MAMKESSKKLQRYLKFKLITPSLRAKLEQRKEIYSGRLQIINKILTKKSLKEKQSGTGNSKVV